MADATTKNLKTFDAYVDENGQNMGQDSATDLARPAALRRRLEGDPGGEAETARLASGRKSEGAEEETAAEIPAGTLDRLSDPTAGAKTPAAEALDRATAALGKE